MGISGAELIAERAGLADELVADRSEIRAGLTATLPASGALDRDRLRWILHADRAALWRSEGCRNTAEYLSALFQISNWKARRWVEAAHALEHLPLIAAALENGSLSLDKTVELTRFATPETEKKLLTWARRVTVGGVRSRADTEMRRAVEETQTALHDRSLTWSWWDDRLSFEGELPAEQGAALIDAIDSLASSLPSDPDDDDTPVIPALGVDSSPTIDQRRADALVLLVSGGAADAGQTTVVMHAPLAALAGDDNGCELAGGPALHPETARRLSCDARLRVVLHGEDGDAVGIGRASQIAPQWLREQIFHRDGHTCTFPGCEMKRFLHPHHIHHWARGGATDLANLITVCTTHHKLVHEGRWSVTLDPGAKPVWFRPGGRVHDPGPAPPEVVEPPPSETLRLSAAAGYLRLFDALVLGGRGPERFKISPRTAARIRELRLPDWFVPN